MTTIKNDATAVRLGEELDVAALDKYLRHELGPQLSKADANAKLELNQFPGGHSNLTYLVSYGEQEFVLRRPPMGPVAPTAHDMPREYKLLSIIHPHFPLAPKPVLVCEDSSIIGVPFYLMERRRGLILRSKLPAPLVENLELRRRLSESVVDTLVRLHAVDIESTGIVQIGKPTGFVQRQVRGWAERWLRSKTGDLAEMDQVIAWLSERLSSLREGEPTIVHNDFKLDNIMIDTGDFARVRAVLDWEMCTVGEPLVDVGLFLSYWTMKGPGKEVDQTPSLRSVTNDVGWLTREQIIERYATTTGRDLSSIVFYETFARFKVAVVIQQIYFRYVQGQTRDERFSRFDSLVRELIREALELAQQAGI